MSGYPYPIMQRDFPDRIALIPKPETMSPSSDRSLSVSPGYIGSVPASILPSGVEKWAGVQVRPLRRGPTELEDLLHARDDAGRAAAWKSFLDGYEPTILHTLRQIGEDPRDLKDRHASVLEQLTSDNFRRLRQYSSDARSSFTTWLCVCVRRMGTVHENRRNGQGQSLVDGLAKFISAPDRQALEAALRDLPSRDRLLLKLRFEFCLSARRISTLMSFPTQAHVKRRCDALCEALAARQGDS